MDIFKSFIDGIMEAQTKTYDLTSIYLFDGIVISDGDVKKIKKGDRVKVENGMLVNIPEGEQPTHEITRLHGTLNNAFLYADVIGLDGGIAQQIEIK